MKPAERKRIARAIGTAVPGLHTSGRILAATPMGRVLRGLYIEDSSDPHRVYLWAFVQPLFVPATTVVLSLGTRLGGGSRTWSVVDIEAAAAGAFDDGLRFFGPVSSVEALSNWSLLEGRSDEYAREARAYSLIAAGQFSEGAKASRTLASTISGGPAWMTEIKKRAEHLASLAETDPSEAQGMLTRWESETKSALRVDDIP